jgi:hypothetical protein
MALLYFSKMISPYQHIGVCGVNRIRRAALASGIVTTIATGIIIKPLITPLPNHFGMYLFILFIIGPL